MARRRGESLAGRFTCAQARGTPKPAPGTMRQAFDPVVYNQIMSDSVLSVPHISSRIRILDAAIKDVVAQIATQFNLRRIILFGSYAYGYPKPESDVDLLVVMDTSLSETRQAVEILKTISYRFGIDLLMYRPTPRRLWFLRTYRPKL